MGNSRNVNEWPIGFPWPRVRRKLPAHGRLDLPGAAKTSCWMFTVEKRFKCNQTLVPFEEKQKEAVVTMSINQRV